MKIMNASLPDWVSWIAQDENGAWWGFEHEPNQHHQGWYENELGRCILICNEKTNPDWKNSLEQIKFNQPG